MYIKEFKETELVEIKEYLENTVGFDQKAIVKKLAITGIMEDIKTVIAQKKAPKRWELRLGVSILRYESGNMELYTDEEGEGSL